MPSAYFAYDTTLAGLKNIETIVSTPFHVLPDGVVPLLAKSSGYTLSQKTDRSGTITVVLSNDVLLRTEFNALIYDLFGGFTTGDVQRYISAIDETANYSPFLCTIKKPDAGEDYRIVNATWVADLRLTLRAPVLQSVTKTSNFTATTSERLTYVDTSSGNVTGTLFAVASATPNTIYSYQKTSASNTFTLDGNSTETIDGATTKAVTALQSRINIYTPDNAVWLTV